jgi:LacI family transcriptional regulator
MTLAPKNVFYVDDSTADLRRAARSLARRGAANRVTGIFATADKLAVDLMDALKDCGISVPGDISLVGFDDMAISAHTVPGLSTIRQDISRKARLAVDLLFNQIETKAPAPPHTVLDVSLVERESVRTLSAE